ncbi:glyoxalase [Fictibacillus phosphorivorans]|uniref:Glyoxalase n=1 Tax=Fictibacillus phosphorivorans TaxID=1221500 RepID=A0A161J6M3_9BACL|nr:VOC family protein [Fictibacillus phosphorivorans]ANC76419.1 glyoxalase [Fictibacillus phosphorivorans]
MIETLIRVGTTYVPVRDVDHSARWYREKLGATISYCDHEKAILNLADQSFFLVRSLEGETSNFTDFKGNKRFSLTFEVDGMEVLTTLHAKFKQEGVQTGTIENRGHPGRNFVFYDPDGNIFDVWSILSPTYKALRKEAVLETER